MFAILDQTTRKGALITILPGEEKDQPMLHKQRHDC